MWKLLWVTILKAQASAGVMGESGRLEGGQQEGGTLKQQDNGGCKNKKASFKKLQTCPNGGNRIIN